MSISQGGEPAKIRGVTYENKQGRLFLAEETQSTKGPGLGLCPECSRSSKEATVVGAEKDSR